jgi:hypothetical protein
MLKSRVLLIYVPQPYALRSSRVLRTTYLLLSETPAVDHHAAQQRVHRIVLCYSVSSLRLCHVHSSALLSPRQSQGDAAPRQKQIRKREIQGAATRSGGAGAPQTHVLARQRLRHEKIGQCRAA